ncbi:MAG TPA: hypothetical protein DC046_00720 [Rhodospirillaceae bacterium]|nr:hypothetical protein [Rhodospirillaceae bacterium]
MTRRQFLSTFFAGLTVAGLSACGRKNQPKHPPGSEFPQEYPYFPPEKRGVPSVKPAEDNAEPMDRSQFLKLDTIPDRTR